MLSINDLVRYLEESNAAFEIIPHQKPIVTTADAEGLFDLNKAAPVFVVKTESGLMAFMVSSQRGRIDFKLIKELLGFAKFKMADKNEIKERTGYEVGTIPLVGHQLPCLLDRKLLEFDFIYGGTGDICHTLKISPQDIIRLNPETRIIEW